MYKSNCKKLPFTNKKSQANSIFALSIKSKQRPFEVTDKKQNQQNNIQQEQKLEIKYFPAHLYKDFLKGEKIYIECYYKDKLISSGYEPYIEAMNGEIAKRLTPSTTVIIANQMTYEKYQKLKTRITKTCRPQTRIVSILWIEQIYRQKRKVQKQLYLFDERKDIVDWRQHQTLQEQQPMSEHFERQVFKKDLFSDLEHYLQNPDQDIQFRISQNNRKFKKQELNNPQVLWILPHKFNIFENEEEQQKYKQISRTYKNPKIQILKNEKKKQQKSNQEVKKRNSIMIGQRGQRRKPTLGRRTQKLEIQGKFQQKKQAKNDKKIQQKKQVEEEQVNQKQDSYKESDSEFLKRIRGKKQLIPQQSINTILDKYLKKPEADLRKEQKRLTDIQELISAENFSNQLYLPQEVQIPESHYRPQNHFNEQQKQNSQSDNQKRSQQNSKNLRWELTESTKKTKHQQRHSVLYTQQRTKRDRLTQGGPRSQLFSKTKSLGKSSNPQRQKKMQEYMNEFKFTVEQFLEKIGYIEDQSSHLNKNNFSNLIKPQSKIVYNIVIKQPYIISRVNDFNDCVKEKLPSEKQILFNIIDFDIWNKQLMKTPFLKFLINFRDLTGQIMQEGRKQRKIEIIKELFQDQQVSEQVAISNYKIMCELVTSQEYRGLNFYFLCNKKNKNEILMGYLSQIEKKNILDYNVLKSVFDLLKEKDHKSKSKQIGQNSLSMTMSMTSETNSAKSRQQSLRQRVQDYIFPNNRIKARLTPEIIIGKKITCIQIKQIKNVEFIVKRLKGRFVPLQNYMNDVQNPDIVINDKRSHSKAKNVWYPDYETFVNSLIVIQ